MSPVLVTGGSGSVGTQLIAALLCDGRQVRATGALLARAAGGKGEVERARYLLDLTNRRG